MGKRTLFHIGSAILAVLASLVMARAQDAKIEEEAQSGIAGTWDLASCSSNLGLHVSTDLISFDSDGLFTDTPVYLIRRKKPDDPSTLITIYEPEGVKLDYAAALPNKAGISVYFSRVYPDAMGNQLEAVKVLAVLTGKKDKTIGIYCPDYRSAAPNKEKAYIFGRRDTDRTDAYQFYPEAARVCSQVLDVKSADEYLKTAAIRAWLEEK